MCARWHGHPAKHISLFFLRNLHATEFLMPIMALVLPTLKLTQKFTKRHVICNETLFNGCRDSRGFGCKAHMREMAAYSLRSFNIENSFANRINFSYSRVIWSIVTNTIGVVLAELNKIAVTIRLKSFIDNSTCLLSSTAIGLTNFAIRKLGLNNGPRWSTVTNGRLCCTRKFATATSAFKTLFFRGVLVGE